MAVSFDVIIPGLMQALTLDGDDDYFREQLPALDQIMRFAHRDNARGFDFESMLAASLGMTSSTLAFASAFDEDYSAGRSFLCQAIHLKPDMHSVIILPLSDSQRDIQDISIIINDLSDYFKDDLSFKMLGTGHWLMQLRQCEVPHSYPHLLSVIGCKADPYIQQSRDTLVWYQLINELQMFMHSHSVNQNRQQERLMTINSLWCWGNGELSPVSTEDICVYCDDHTVRAFLNQSGIPVEPVRKVNDGKYQHKNICLDLSLLKALKTDRGEEIRSILKRIDMTILQPLLFDARSGKINLRLCSGHQYDYEISRLSSLRFWRKRIRLHMLVEQ